MRPESSMAERDQGASLRTTEREERVPKSKGTLYLAVFDLPRHEIGETNRARVGNRETECQTASRRTGVQEVNKINAIAEIVELDVAQSRFSDGRIS